MSRIPKWKLEKLKVKVVFRLQFHATHIPQPGWDKLFLSFIPIDLGKVTAKTTKANVRNGTCKWSDPIYETTRLLQDPVTRTYDEKLYKFVVAMGTSRSSILGEVDINLADLVDAVKPLSVSLPLHGCDFGTVLHVTYQLLTSKTGFREFEQQRELADKGLQMSSVQRLRDHSKASVYADVGVEHLDKVNAKERFKAETTVFSSAEKVVHLNDPYEDSAPRIDDLSYTSENLCSERNDIVPMQEFYDLTTVSGESETGSFPLALNTQNVKEEQQNKRLSGCGGIDSIHGWSSDYYADNNHARAYEVNNGLRVKLEIAGSTISQLKLEVSSLQSFAVQLGSETESLSQCFTSELALGEKLNREISLLKSECSVLKDNLEILKSSRVLTPENNNIATYSYYDATPSKWLQDLLLIEARAKEIESKLRVKHYGCDIDLGYAYFEVLDRVIQNLKQALPPFFDEMDEKHLKDSQLAVQQQQYPACEPYEWKKDVNMMKETNYELLNQLEKSRVENKSLERKIDQMECYYQPLIHQLEESWKQSQSDLENIKMEHNSCLCTVASLEDQVKQLHRDMGEQYRSFSEGQHRIDSINKILQEKAISAETALKKVRWNYSIAVDCLQKDLELLSSQVLSMYETNKNLAKHCFTDTSEFNFLNYSDENMKVEKLNFNNDGSWHSYHQEKHTPDVKRLSFEASSVKSESEISSLSNGAVGRDDFKMYCKLGTFQDNSFCKMRESMNADFKINCGRIDSGATLSTETTRIRPTKTATGLHLNAKCEYARSEISFLDFDKQTFVEKASIQEMNREKLTKHYSEAVSQSSEVQILTTQLEFQNLVLEEILRNVSNNVWHLNKKIEEVGGQLDISTALNDSLASQLQFACDDARILKDNQAKYISRCDELRLQNELWELKIQDIEHKYTLLSQRNSEFEQLALECEYHERKYISCNEEKMKLEALLKQEISDKTKLEIEYSSILEDFKGLKNGFNTQEIMKNKLQNSIAYLQGKLGDMCSFMFPFNEQVNGVHDVIQLKQDLETKNYSAIILHLGRIQEGLCARFLELCKENKRIAEERDAAETSLRNIESQILFTKQVNMSDIKELTSKLDFSKLSIYELELKLSDLKENLRISSEAGERLTFENIDLLSKLKDLEDKHQHAVNENKDLLRNLMVVENAKVELEVTKQSHANSLQESNDLKESLRCTCVELQIVEAFNQQFELEVANLTSQLDDKNHQLISLTGNLMCMHDELQFEKESKQKLVLAVAVLASELNEKNHQLLSFNEQAAELANFRQSALVQERQITDLHDVLSCNEEYESKQDGMVLSLCNQVSDIESQLQLATEYLLSAETEATCMRHQFSVIMKNMSHRIMTREWDFSNLYEKNENLVLLLNDSKIIESRLVEENKLLSETHESLKSEFEAIVAERTKLVEHADRKHDMLSQVEALKVRLQTLESVHANEKIIYEDEIGRLHTMLMSFEDLDCLSSSFVELEITNIILFSKLGEQHLRILFLMHCESVLKKLRKEHIELNCRLSELFLTPEEFENFVTHPRESKDEAEIDYIRDNEIKENDAWSPAIQNPFGISFIKGLCEERVLELKNQVYASKKHGEEMLLKLKNALIEVENGKKEELSLAQRNEELSIKILDLETDLKIATNEQRELMNTYDIMKAELECASLSLDCFKEEKQKLETSLVDCNEEKTKLKGELDLVKRLLENMASSADIIAQKNHLLHTASTTSIGQILEDNSSTCQFVEEAPIQKGPCHAHDTVVAETLVPNNADMDGQPITFDTLVLSGKVEASKLVFDGSSRPSFRLKLEELQSNQSSSVSGDTLLDEAHISQFKEQCKEQERLKTEMDHLSRELERLKTENMASLLCEEDYHLDLALEGLERELIELEKANKHLGNLFPSFKTFPGSGNALERVLALELELAEALQAKNKPTIRFQSSFLKQHNDEAAVFRSFMDINDLIKDMLELKRRNTIVETELKEMHGRYTELSLQFAEVEGERQRLLMTLKCRTPRK